MILTVKNLGLIAEMELDLSRQLLVFCGPNNTGKTYASYALYSLHTLSTNSSGLDQQFPLPFGIDELIGTGAVEFDVNQYFLQYKNDILDLITNHIKQKLPDLFASTKAHFEKSELRLILREEHFQQGWAAQQYHHKLALGNQFTLELLKAKDEPSTKILLIAQVQEHSYGQNQEEVMPTPSADLLTFQLKAWIASTILKMLFPVPFLIPAERIAIQLFARELALGRSRSIDQILKSDAKGRGSGKITNRADLYPLPIRDALALSEDANIFRQQKSPLAPLALWLEKTVLGGKIGISKDGELDYLPNNHKKPMPLHTAASMVKSLALLVLYLRHIAQPNDLLILDEPELNLHPNNQVQLARFICRLMKYGVKVLMTTHSDYIIRELNNMTMLNSLKSHRKEMMLKHGYEADELLDYKLIGAYAFGGGMGEYPTRLQVDPDGFAVPTLDHITSTLNLASDEIAFYLGKEMDLL